MHIKSDTPEKEIPNLRPLMPSYLPKEHEGYVKLLTRAVYDNSCRNVALTGSYGSGKSSILSSFIQEAEARGHRIAKISLVALKAGEMNHGADVQADNQPTNNDPGNDFEGELTAYLEREILGQLIYQGEPSESRASAFNRVHDLTKKERKTRAVIIALAVYLLFFFASMLLDDQTGTPFLLVSTIISTPLPVCVTGIFLAICSLIALYALAYAIVPYLPQGISIGGIGAAGASLALDAKSDKSYFNKYRDEIVYLFEANRFDTVVFEDIDRFDNQEIFLALKSLNFTLNNAPRIKKRDYYNYVSFIYAVKDSLFETRSSQTDVSVVEGSDRTKLFDLIISVVPFVSSFSAYDEARRLFKQELLDVGEDTLDGSHFNELLRLSSSYVADMRLMTSIRNDYLVMLYEMGPIESETEKLMNVQHAGLGLTHTGILAMAIYKNISPGEFERLRLGKGVLNEIYDTFERSIRRELEPLQKALATLKANDHDNTPPNSALQLLGKELTSQIEKHSNGIQCIELGNTVYSLSKNGSTNVWSESFWNGLSALSADSPVKLVGSYSTSITLNKYEFIRLFSQDAIVPAAAQLLRFGVSPTAQKEIEHQIHHLQSADFADETDLIVQVNEDNKNSEVLFIEYVQSKLGYGLASELVLYGYIGKDFELYTSKYPKGARANAINFIAHCFRRNTIDISFSLDEGDCREILRVIPKAHLNRPGALNYDLLIYLLSDRNHIDAASMMVEGCLECFDGAGKLLISLVLSSLDVDTQQAKTLVSLIMERFDRAIEFLVGDYGSALGDPDRLELANIVFSCFSPKREYYGRRCSKWIESHLGDIDFTPCGHRPEIGEAIAHFFESSGIVAHSLNQLEDFLMTPIVQLGIYSINRSNLVTILGNDQVDPMDLLIEKEPALFDKIAESPHNLTAYLDSLAEDECSLRQWEANTINSLCSAISHWDADSSPCEALKSFIAKADNRITIHSVAEITRPLSANGLQDHTGEVIDKLISRKMIECSLPNSIALAKIKMPKNDDGMDAFEAFVAHLKNPLIQGDLTVTNSELISFVNRMLQSRGISDQLVERILDAIGQSNLSVLPLDVNQVWTSPSHRNTNLLIELLKDGVVQTAEKVYLLLKESPWKKREEVIAIWEKGADMRAALNFPLLPRDVPHVISSRKLRDGVLFRTVMNNWRAFLDRASLSETERIRLQNEIQRRMKKVLNQA